MIRETIVTTQSETGYVHVAPMGIHERQDQILIMPFRPSTTLDNLLKSKCAIVNFTDDVRLFAGCLTGRRNWPLSNANVIRGKRLTNALSHIEVEIERVEDDNIRPQLYCKIVHESTHAPFRGFNRAQTSVLEAAILVSRLDRLPWSKIETEIVSSRCGNGVFGKQPISMISAPSL